MDKGEIYVRIEPSFYDSKQANLYLMKRQNWWPDCHIKDFGPIWIGNEHSEEKYNKAVRTATLLNLIRSKNGEKKA